MQKKLFVISLIFFSFAALACKHQKTIDRNSIGGFDISKNDEHILFSSINNNHSALYQINIDGTGYKRVLYSRDTDYFIPKYSKNSDKILFTAYPKIKGASCLLYIANPDGTNKEKILTDTGIITSAVFSGCENKIYYAKANTYGHSSPLGTDQPHTMDIYSVNLDNKKIEKITNLKVYGIYKISEYDCKHILMYMPMEDKGGMILLTKDSSNVITRINPINSPRPDLTMYYTPSYSKQHNTLGFIATYELMIMSMGDKQAKIVVNRAGKSQFDDFIFFNSKEKILFTTVGETSFNIVNFNGSDLQSIELPAQ